MYGNQPEPQAGQVWEYFASPGPGHRLAPTGDLIRLTRPGKRPGDWRGVQLQGLSTEWTVCHEQIRDGRYRLVHTGRPGGRVA